MNEPKPVQSPLVQEERFAWVTRNKKLMSVMGISALLILFFFMHRSTAVNNEQVQKKTHRERTKPATSTPDPRIIPEGEPPSGTTANRQAPEKTKLQQAREDLKYKSLYSFNITEYKQPPVAAHPLDLGSKPAPSAPEDDSDGPIEDVSHNINCKGSPDFLLPESTLLEGVLLDKVDGEQGGTVDLMLRTPVYFPRTKVMLFPQGTRFLGETKPVNAYGQRRLAMEFHRILVFNEDPFKTCSISIKAPATDQQGSTGIGGKVNNHILSSIGIAGVVGLIAGIGQIGNSYGGYGYDPGVEMRNGVSRSMSQESMQILDRFLRQWPSVVIPPGTRVNIRLVNDLWVPAVTEEVASDTLR